jgi:hypothetical protein
MSVTRVRIDYTGMGQVGQTFGREANNVRNMVKDLKSSMPK